MEKHKQGGRQGFRNRENRNAEMCGDGRGQIEREQLEPEAECNIWSLQGTLASLPQTSLDNLLVPQCRTLPKNGRESGQGTVKRKDFLEVEAGHWRGKWKCEQSWGRGYR